MPSPAPRARRLVLLAALAPLALAGCVAVEDVRHAATNLIPGRIAPKTAALSTPPREAARPRAPLSGDIRARDLVTGETLSFRVAARGDTVTVREPDGCVWTRRGDWFAPSSRWEGCGDARNWSAGAAEVRASAGLWPLRPGAEGRYSRRAVSHTGRRLERESVCRVERAEAVLRESGARSPAWVVRCADGKRTRTTWWSPEEGPVAFRVEHAEKGVEQAWVRL